LATVLAFLPELTVSDLCELAAPGVLPENLRHYLQAEIHRRLQKPKLPSDGESEDPGANSGE
ncbi:MAG TPA: hypothetical protein VK514_04270, partial [Candidatus Acidoferrum sp.]|nr:hypothetical protein [Candidatus Acidoferrum sp.]